MPIVGTGEGRRGKWGQGEGLRTSLLFHPFRPFSPTSQGTLCHHPHLHTNKNRQTEGFSLAVAVSLRLYSRQATIPTRLGCLGGGGELHVPGRRIQHGEQYSKLESKRQ